VLNALPVSITISVDGATKETVEKIRVNCQYEEHIRNIYRFREYTRKRGTYMSLAHCLMTANWHEFGDVLLLAEKLECEVFVNTVVSPPALSLYELSPTALSQIVTELEQQGVALAEKLAINKKVWDTQLASLRSNAHGRETGYLTQ